ELAARRPAAARRDLALVGAEIRLLRAAGVNTDVELALYEADHGSPRRGIVLARRALAQAPSVRSADALGWSLARAGRPREGLSWLRRALRLGSRDPSFLYHAGAAAAEAGLALRVDGRAVALRPVGAGRIAFPPGQGGLRLTRVELRFRASAVGARRVELRDSTFRDRIGWRDIIVRPGADTAVRSSVPAREPTGGLRRYPRDLISSP